MRIDNPSFNPGGLNKVESASFVTATAISNSNGSYIDIGDVRYQWGQNAGSSGLRTQTLPAPFRDDTYAVTANPSLSDTGVRSIGIDGKTTTTFNARVVISSGGSGVGFSWIAIGLKP
jgi:hypothetical protein